MNHKESWLKRTNRSIRISRLNIKKKKGTSFAIGFMVIVVVALLIMGLKISFNLNENYYLQSEKMHSEHDFVVMKSETYQDCFTQYLQEDNRIEEFEVRDCIDFNDMEIYYDNGIISTSFIFEDINQQNNINHLTLTDCSESISSKEAIYVSEVMKTKGFSTGDAITFQNEIWEKTYYIAGFFKTTSRGIENCAALRFYLNEDGFQNLYLTKGLKTEVLIRCYDTKDATPVYNDFLSHIKDHVVSNDEYKEVWGCDYNMMQYAYSLMAMLGSVAIVGFAFIISIITLLVIRFQIQNNIEHSIQEIGILGALGYQSKEICLVFAGEYIFIAVIGAIIGLFLSYFVLPLFGNILLLSVGLQWTSYIEVFIDSVVMLLLILIVAFTTLMTAKKAKKYTPHVALSQGILNHSFRKNTFPLDKKGNVLVQLAGKEWFQMKKQNIMMVICLAGVTFAIMFATMLYSTFISDIKLVTKMVGMELSDVQVELTDYSDPKIVQGIIDGMDEVRKTNLGLSNYGYINDISVAINVYDDFKKLETENVYQGRFCEYDNEVVITGAIAKLLHKNIGDTLSVTVEENTYDYIITGFTQCMSEVGMMIKLTKAGYQKLVPSAHLNSCYIYMKDGVSRKDFINHLRKYFGLDVNGELKNDNLYEKYQKIADEKMRTMMNIYGVKEMDYSILVDGIIVSGNTRKYMIRKVTDIYEFGQSTMASMQIMLKIVTYAILAITAMIVTILLAMMIKMVILKKKVHYGIMRALGYTTPQLMLQISISFMPAIIIGVILGIIICYYSAGALTTLMLTGIGITNMQFSISIVTFIVVGILIVLFSFVIAMVQAFKVRKLSVYELLTE